MQKLLTYGDLAEKLGIRKETLSRQIAQANMKKATAIKPDKVDKTGNLPRFYFKPSSIPGIKKRLAQVVRPVGRPKK